jgi:hypothetical protein
MPIELVDNGLGITQKATVEETSRGIYLLKRNSKVARVMAIGLTICVIVIWPWTMYGSSYIYLVKYFLLVKLFLE